MKFMRETCAEQDAQTRYLALGNTQATRFAVANLQSPEHACGKAHRVGSTAVGSQKVTLYRIRIRVSFSRKHMMLPYLFALNASVLQQYQP